MSHRLLLVEEDTSGGSGLGRLLGGLGFFFERVAWPSWPITEAHRRRAELLVASGLAGPTALLPFFRQLRVEALGIPTLAVLPQHVEDVVVREVSQVADDFVLWPLSRDTELQERLLRLLPREVTEVEAASTRLMQEMGFTQLLGRDPVFLAAIKRIPRLGQTDGPSLITGETGTGKELCARAIHHLSRRSRFPFIPVDCGAIPDHLFENEVFGHARGAFTDAREDRRGLIALAEGGTLLLDEIDSLSMAVQAKLLRFVQERTYRPLGADRFIRADVNLISSTNQDLEARVRDGRFRSDLFFRLNVIRLDLPPLRERRADIALLAHHVVDTLGGHDAGSRKTLSASALSRLTQHDWPGNVRELFAIIQGAMMFAQGAQILPRDLALPARPCPVAAGAGGFRRARASMIETFERQYVEDMLRKHRGNVTRAAQEAQKDRRTFGRLVKKVRHRSSRFLILRRTGAAQSHFGPNRSRSIPPSSILALQRRGWPSWAPWIPVPAWPCASGRSRTPLPRLIRRSERPGGRFATGVCAKNESGSDRARDTRVLRSQSAGCGQPGRRGALAPARRDHPSQRAADGPQPSCAGGQGTAPRNPASGGRGHLQSQPGEPARGAAPGARGRPGTGRIVMSEGPFDAGQDACDGRQPRLSTVCAPSPAALFAPPDEYGLLDAVSRGNEGAFWILWHRHRPHLYEVCLRRMSGVTADADDAVSRSMFVARQKLTAYAPQIVNLEAWLTRMACNVCADLRRQRRRREQGAVSLDHVMTRDHPAQPMPSPEEVCSSREVGAMIHRGIVQLPRPLREPARLRLLHEVDYQAIAKRLAITPENARKRVQQARAILRQRLERDLSSYGGQPPAHLDRRNPIDHPAGAGRTCLP